MIPLILPKQPQSSSLSPFIYQAESCRDAMLPYSKPAYTTTVQLLKPKWDSLQVLTSTAATANSPKVRFDVPKLDSP